MQRISILLLFITAILCSCSKKSADGHQDSAVKDSVAAAQKAAADSVAKAQELTVDKIETAEQAVNFMKKSGHWAEYEKGIIPRMVVEHLPYAIKLLQNEHSKFLIVDKGSMKVALYDKYGQLDRSYGMACARNYGTKHSKGDSRTPEGFFSVEGKYDSTDWLYTNDAGVTSPVKGQFGPRFIRLKIPTTSQIGIHGTGSPGSIGRRASHGCIRLTNDNILELVKLVEVGMPVIVNPGPQDRKVNEREGCFIPRISTMLGEADPNMNSNTNPKAVVKPKTDTVKVNAKADTTAVQEPKPAATPEPAVEPEPTPAPAPAPATTPETPAE